MLADPHLIEHLRETEYQCACGKRATITLTPRPFMTRCCVTRVGEIGSAKAMCLLNETQVLFLIPPQCAPSACNYRVYCFPSRSRGLVNSLDQISICCIIDRCCSAVAAVYYVPHTRTLAATSRTLMGQGIFLLFSSFIPSLVSFLFFT